MSTFNGFGTLYYGWRHHADGTATATKWFALSWVPVIPLHRERLRVLTNFNNDDANIQSELGGLIVSQVDRYELLENLPLAPKEVCITLVKAYLGIPALLLGPVLLLVMLMKAAQLFGVDVKPGSIGFKIYVGGFFLAVLHVLLQAVRAIRRARGWQPRV